MSLLRAYQILIELAAEEVETETTKSDSPGREADLVAKESTQKTRTRESNTSRRAKQIPDITPADDESHWQQCPNCGEVYQGDSVCEICGHEQQ